MLFFLMPSELCICVCSRQPFPASILSWPGLSGCGHCWHTLLLCVFFSPLLVTPPPAFTVTHPHPSAARASPAARTVATWPDLCSPCSFPGSSSVFVLCMTNACSAGLSWKLARPAGLRNELHSGAQPEEPALPSALGKENANFNLTLNS